MAAQTEFAVVDVETTGVMPERNDRVVEIAIVRIAPNGNMLDQYSTIVNPCRDVGPTHVHGLTAGDVKNAPHFKEIAGDFLARLKGAVFVAHNASFDRRFVVSELKRINCELPDFPYLCTMQLARQADPDIPSRRLEELRRHFDIKESGLSHSALVLVQRKME